MLFSVNEVIRTDMYWINGGFRAKANSWLYVEGLLGLFLHELETEVETNADVYTYDGLSGHRVFGAAGIGAGAETPWDYPLHLFIGGRIWIPMREGSIYESAVGQINAGLSFRF